MPGKRIVLCVGDSHTYGTYGASWVRDLETAFTEVRFFNAGVNGTQIKNVHAKLDKLFAQVCKEKLVAVTLLIGTNDCLLSLAQESNDFWGQQLYRLSNGNTGPANVDTFRVQFTALVAALSERMRLLAPNVTRVSSPLQLLIVTLPPIGEALDDVANQRVDQYNAVIHSVTADLQSQQQQQMTDGVVLDVVLIDLNAQCKVAIRRAFGSAEGASATAAACGSNTTLAGAAAPKAPRRLPSQFWWTGATIACCMFRRYLLGVSYGQQSQLAGMAVLTPDCVHLNDTGAALLAALIAPQLRHYVGSRPRLSVRVAEVER